MYSWFSPVCNTLATALTYFMLVSIQAQRELKDPENALIGAFAGKSQNPHFM